MTTQLENSGPRPEGNTYPQRWSREATASAARAGVRWSEAVSAWTPGHVFSDHVQPLIPVQLADEAPPAPADSGVEPHHLDAGAASPPSVQFFIT